MAKKPFKGIIKLDVRDSVADWEPYLPAKAPAGAPNILVRPVRRHGARGLVAVRRPDQHADPAEGGRPGPDVLAVAHHRAVLADALDPADRTQPPPERHGARSPRARTDFPARTAASRPNAPPWRRFSRTTAGARSGWARTTTCPSRTSPRGATRKQWPLQNGLRPLLRLPRRRDQPVVSGSGRRQQVHRSAVRPGRGLSPLEGPRRPGAPHDSRPLGRPTRRRPWYMWFCPGANHAPHHCPQAYIDKYKGKFDDGYEAYRDTVLPRMIAKGIIPKGTQLTPLNPLPAEVANAERHGAAVGHAQRRREEALLAPDGSLRRLLRVHRRAGRPHHRLPGEERSAREHRRDLGGATTARRARAARTAR